jgi:hypothetical protein
VDVLASLVLIAGWSYKTTFNKELLISSFTLYSTKPNLRNLFMKKRLGVRIVESLVNRSTCSLSRFELCLPYSNWLLLTDHAIIESNQHANSRAAIVL